MKIVGCALVRRKRKDMVLGRLAECATAGQ